MVKFIVNFGLSAIGQFIVFYMAIVSWRYTLWEVAEWTGFMRTLNLPGWAMEVIVMSATVLPVLGSLALCFFLGIKLNLLGNHWLNFLSVCASLVVMPFVLSYLGFFRMNQIAPYVIAGLPSIITWLGMLWQSRGS